MRILITGSRDWECGPLARQLIGRLTHRYGSKIVIVQGGPRRRYGIRDRVSEGALTTEPYPAKWDELGKRAGPVRNAEMIATRPDFVIAIHRDLARARGPEISQAGTRGWSACVPFDHDTREGRHIKADDPH